MKKSTVRVLLAVLILSFASIRCGSSSSLLSSGSSLISSLGSNPNLSTITSLLQTPGLSKALGSSLKPPFTLLAPTNDALSSSGALTTLSNPSNVNQLADMLKNQIVPGKLDAAGLAQSGVTTAAGKSLNLGGANLGQLISGDKFNIIPVDKLLQ
ncbi:MAG TPA: fasciclin domain-containing protein [Puia sp.]|nr:fasciclin domain-containing protein [Puia sp.]